jgi:hypothetical protein
MAVSTNAVKAAESDFLERNAAMISRKLSYVLPDCSTKLRIANGNIVRTRYAAANKITPTKKKPVLVFTALRSSGFEEKL